MSNVEERRTYLAVAKQYFPQHILPITKLLVHNIVEEAEPTPSTAVAPITASRSSINQQSIPTVATNAEQSSLTSADDQLTVQEWDKIRAIDCFDLTEVTSQQIRFAG